jgi:hypothetical protein
MTHSTLLTLLAFPPVLALLVFANLLLCKKYPDTLFLIWYIFSFSFLLFCGLGLIAETKHIGLTELCGSHESTCRTIFDALTNTHDETILLFTILGIGLGPQLMAYMITGPFGAARAPVFVRQLQQFVTWSIIKFFAVLSGILGSIAFVKLTANRFEPEDVLQAAFWLMLSLSYAHMVCTEGKSWAVLLFGADRWLYPHLQRIHRYFTRNAREQ